MNIVFIFHKTSHIHSHSFHGKQINKKNNPKCHNDCTELNPTVSIIRSRYNSNAVITLRWEQSYWTTRTLDIVYPFQWGEPGLKFYLSSNRETQFKRRVLLENATTHPLSKTKNVMPPFNMQEADGGRGDSKRLCPQSFCLSACVALL